MTRQEIYAKIKEYNLQETIKTTCDRNFTQVDSTTLIGFIKLHEEALEETKKPKKQTEKQAPKKCACEKLVEILKKKHILLDSEVTYILS